MYRESGERRQRPTMPSSYVKAEGGRVMEGSEILEVFSEEVPGQDEGEEGEGACDQGPAH